MPMLMQELKRGDQMKRFSLMVIFTGLLAPSLGMADVSGTTKPGARISYQAPEGAGGNEVAGHLVSISNDTLMLLDVRRLEVSPSTKVMKNGSPASLSDVQEGDQVRASFSPGRAEKVEKLDVTSPSGSIQGSTE
jgi:hypothetical protein